MLSPQLRRKVHDLWSLFWSSGLSNPLVAIEQITYLLFIRQLEKLDGERVKHGKLSIYLATHFEKAEFYDELVGLQQQYKGKSKEELAPLARGNWDFSKCRWSYIRQNVSFELLNNTVFPWLRELDKRIAELEPKKDNDQATDDAAAASDENAPKQTDALKQVTGRLSDAYFILDPNKTETLKRAVSLIDELFRQLDTRSVNSDIMGDIFEYLLEEVKESGKNGQFRTPRHVIRFMVELIDPPLGAKVLDPACGSGGFLLNTLLHWKAKHTDEDVLRLEWDGTPHDVHPNWPKAKQPDFNSLFHGYDNDRTMVRIAWMNLILHDLESPEVHQLDTLSKRLSDDQSGTYDIILANPPFTGSVDEGDLSENRDRFPHVGKGKNSSPITTKSELLFVWLMLDLLKIGGRAAVIVPDGVLFGNTNAHRALRRQLLFENTLEAVISLPANMFQPYSGVKTSIIIFQKAADKRPAGEPPRTRDVWFYEVTDEAYSLDQRRKPRFGQDNDLWDALEKFKAWTRCREGEGEAKKGKTQDSLRSASISEDYHQPEYWEERWRSVDDETLKIFPDKANEKGHTFGIHQLWPALHRTPNNADTAVIAAQQKRLQKLFERIAANAAREQKDKAKAEVVAVKAVKDAVNKINRMVKDEGLLDREFDQFGSRALKSAMDAVSAPAIASALGYLEKKGQPPVSKVRPDELEASMKEIIAEFAKLDGYNVWCRGIQSALLSGKLTASDDGSEAKRVPTELSWIVPVRQWAERESWGEDPKTKKLIEKPTHTKNEVDPKYVDWLRDTLKVFDSSDGTVKSNHIHLLDPDCLEALDFNLSAGRHKPFTFDAGQHRPPAELIIELQALHAEVQQRLTRLVSMIDEADQHKPVTRAGRRTLG